MTYRLPATGVLDYFASLVAEDEGFALLEAAIAVAQDEYPGLDPQAVLADIDRLGQRLRARHPALFGDDLLYVPGTEILQAFHSDGRPAWLHRLKSDTRLAVGAAGQV